MIIRSWTATATADNAVGYAAYFNAKVLPHLQSLDGFRTAYLLRRVDSSVIHLRALTLWDSMEAIHAFAGSDASVANVTPEAQALLTDFDRVVEHYESVPLDL